MLIVADFDGTLAPGQRDPAAARIDPIAQRALRRLAAIRAARPDRVHVAILTGRTVVDVAARARVGGIDYLGDHGLQAGVLPRGGRADRIVAAAEPGFERHAAPAEVLATGVSEAMGRPPWLFVERKGASVAFHVRQADDIPAARSAVLEAIVSVEAAAGLHGHGLVPYRGRSVVDLRPAEAGGKRDAVERLIDRYAPAAVVSFGDDLSDVDAFDAVIAAREAGRIQVGRTVGVRWRDATPPEVLDRADLVLGSARAVGRMLGALARRIDRDQAPPGEPAAP